MILSQLSVKPMTLKQRVYLFGGANNNPTDLEESVRLQTPHEANPSRVGSALSPKMPYKKMKEEPKLVLSI